MLRLLILLLCVLSAVFSAKGQHPVRLEDVLRPGTRLVYGVESRGMEYDFIVTIKNASGAGGFSWQMTAPVNLMGTVVHSQKALQSGNRMYNYFHGGTDSLDDATLSVWVSRLACRTLVQAGIPFTMYLHGDNNPPTPVSSSGRATDLEVLVNGRAVSIRELLVRPHNQPAAVSSGSTAEQFFTIYPSPSLPLILRMSIGFYIGLKEIRT